MASSPSFKGDVDVESSNDEWADDKFTTMAKVQGSCSKVSVKLVSYNNE